VANERGDTPRSFLKRQFPFDRSTLSYDRVTRRFFAVSARRQGRMLAAALAAAKTAKCCVLVSKLDRLSRDVAFIAGLMAQRGPVHRRRTRPRRSPSLVCF